MKRIKHGLLLYIDVQVLWLFGCYLNKNMYFTISCAVFVLVSIAIDSSFLGCIADALERSHLGHVITAIRKTFEKDILMWCSLVAMCVLTFTATFVLPLPDDISNTNHLEMPSTVRNFSNELDRYSELVDEYEKAYDAYYTHSAAGYTIGTPTFAEYFQNMEQLVIDFNNMKEFNIAVILVHMVIVIALFTLTADLTRYALYKENIR